MTDGARDESEFDKFTRAFLHVRQRLDDLFTRTPEAGIRDLLDALGESIEELAVAQEEMRAQNEELVSARNAIELERNRYQRLFDFAPDAYLVTDHYGIIRESNRAAETILGVPAGKLSGSPLPIFIPKGERGGFRRRLERLRAASQAEPWETTLQPKEGPPIQVSVHVSTDPAQLRWLLRDITREKRLGQRLRLVAGVVDMTAEGIVITDRHGTIELANPAFCRRTGYVPEALVGQSTDLFMELEPSEREGQERALASVDQWQNEVWVRHVDGSVHRAWLLLAAIRDEHRAVTNYLGIYSDLSTRRELQHQLHHLAYYDSLTNLPNRQLFFDRLQVAVSQSARAGQLLAVFYMDLDGFKGINDTLGHRAGDELLRQVATRVQACVRKGDTFARMGGDEFTVVLPLLSDREDAVGIAAKIRDAFTDPFMIGGRAVAVASSFGISLYPRDSSEPHELVQHADSAMYHAKRAGGGRYLFYHPDLSGAPEVRTDLQSELKRALSQGGLTMVFQPLIGAPGGNIVGMEALARWCHPKLGNIPPVKFLPLADAAGLLDELTEWELLTACRQAKAWADAGIELGTLALNVSVRQMGRARFLAQVGEILQATGLTPSTLAFEFNEKQLLHNSELIAGTLDPIRKLGIHMTIDNFGTGQLSVETLARMPIDKIKFDRSLLERGVQRPSEVTMIARAVAVAGALGLKVAASGAQTREEAALVKAMNCDEVQGYLFGAPASSAEATRLLAAAAPGSPRS